MYKTNQLHGHTHTMDGWAFGYTYIHRIQGHRSDFSMNIYWDTFKIRIMNIYNAEEKKEFSFSLLIRYCERSLVSFFLFLFLGIYAVGRPPLSTS